MEFRVLSGQHLTAFEYEDTTSSSTPYITRFGAMYTGEQFKITTSGERAIIYKKKEKFPNVDGKYTYSYFLLGNGEILSHQYVNLRSGYSGWQTGWGQPIVPTSSQSSEMSLKTVFDSELINNPINWSNTVFYNNRKPKKASSYDYNNIFCANMEVGSKLSNVLAENELNNMFFGYPSSMEDSYCYTPADTAISKFYGGVNDNKMPLIVHYQAEPLFKSTLLWDSNGKLTNYGRIFANKTLLDAFEVYNLLDSNSFTGLAYRPSSLGHNQSNPFSFDSSKGTNMGITISSNSERYATSKRLGSSTKVDLKDGLADDYLFLGIYVTEDYESAKKYIDDGTVPDDAKKVDEIGTTPIDDEDDTQNEDGKDNSKRDDQPIHNPDNTALNSGSTTYFYMGKAGLSSFIKWFWNDTGDFESIVNNYISNLYGDLKECITGVFHFPCPLNALCSATGNKEIVIGRYHTSINADFLKNPPKNILLGTVDLSDDKWKNTNSFLDYDGYTTISMYLPYLGVVDLPTKTVQKTKLSVYYAVDVPSMQMKYTIKSDGIIVHEQVVQFGDDIPISLSSGLQNVTNTVSAVTGMASDVALLGTMGGGKKAIASTLVHTVANAHTTTDGITVKGNSSGVMGKWGSLKCALIVTKPISKRPSNYAKIKGNLICDTYKLSSLTGLTICENPRITFTNAKPTEKEIEEIYSYLEKGVIL